MMDEFIELLRQSVERANEENGTSWGYVMLFDDGTVTYRTGGTVDAFIGFYESLGDFIGKYGDKLNEVEVKDLYFADVLVDDGDDE